MSSTVEGKRGKSWRVALVLALAALLFAALVTTGAAFAALSTGQETGQASGVNRAFGSVPSERSAFARGGAALAGPSNCAWEVVPSPNPGTMDNTLRGVDAVAADEAWAVGRSGAVGGLYSTLALHWNDGGWSVVPSPNPGINNELYAVSAVAANDVWAVGTRQNGGYETLVLHWDGNTWSVVPSPNPGTSGNYLTAVSALAANDVWAVGSHSMDGGLRKTLVQRWNGTSWSVVPSPNVGIGTNILTGVSAISANDVWAVGYYGANPRETLVLHWDGTSWSVVPSPNPGTDNRLTGVSAIAGNDVWAVGYYDTGAFVFETLAIHWDGTSWTVRPTPNQSSQVNYLNGVSALATNDVWAVGDYLDQATSDTATLVLHWDGTTWSVVPSPNQGTTGNYLNAVSALSADDVWAVGAYSSGGSLQTLVEHYSCLMTTRTVTRTSTTTPTVTPTSTPTGTPVCGLRWRTGTGPNTGSPRNNLYGVSALSATDAWAVGYHHSAQTGPRPLITRWDGTTWNLMPTPAVAAILRGVAALAPDDVWAVGYYTNAKEETLGTIVMHWDGAQWSIVVAPSPTPQSALYDIAAVSADDIWAVGGGGAFILHWDGDAWEISTPPPSDGRVLSGVTALSADDVWVVGTAQSGQFDTYPLAMHWDGSQWSVVPTPALLDSGLRAVDAFAPNDVWAVGTDDLWGSPVIMHWNGTQWSDVPNPAPGNTANALLGVAAVASNDVWAVGMYENSPPGGVKALLQHWDGSAWTTYPTLDPPARMQLYAVTHVSSTDVWAVGERWTGSFTTVPLVAHYHDPCAGTPSPVPTNTRTATATVGPTYTQVPTATACTLTFADVPTDNTFYPFVRCLACQGIINGYPCGGAGEPCNPNNDPYFRPNNYVTRGQLAKIVSESAGFDEEVPPSQWTFTDVPYGSTFWLWVERLARREVMAGYACGGPNEPCDSESRPYFRPGSGATRGQLTKIVSNAAGFDDTIPPAQYTFTDVPPTHTFWLFVERLLSNRPGVMGGYTCGGGPGEPCDPENRAYFRPNNPLTRGQTSKIVANTFFLGCNPPRP